jgi:hypothetical protein
MQVLVPQQELDDVFRHVRAVEQTIHGDRAAAVGI